MSRSTSRVTRDPTHLINNRVRPLPFLEHQHLLTPTPSHHLLRLAVHITPQAQMDPLRLPPLRLILSVLIRLRQLTRQGTLTQTGLRQRAPTEWRRTTIVARKQFLIRCKEAHVHFTHLNILDFFSTLVLKCYFYSILGATLLVVHCVLRAEQQGGRGVPCQQPIGDHRRVHQPQQQEQQEVLSRPVVQREPQLDDREHAASHWEGSSPLLCGWGGLCRMSQRLCHICAGN